MRSRRTWTRVIVGFVVLTTACTISFSTDVTATASVAPTEAVYVSRYNQADVAATARMSPLSSRDGGTLVDVVEIKFAVRSKALGIGSGKSFGNLTVSARSGSTDSVTSNGVVHDVGTYQLFADVTDCTVGNSGDGYMDCDPVISWRDSDSGFIVSPFPEVPNEPRTESL